MSILLAIKALLTLLLINWMGNILPFADPQTLAVNWIVYKLIQMEKPL